MEHPKSARWEFLRNLPDKIRKEKVFYVHGSPLDPTFEYVFPDAFGRVWDPVRIEEFFLQVNQLCFCGHTHIPCAIGSDLGCMYPPACDYKLAFDPAKKYIINTGSVGQPRDRDKRACYLLFDEINHSVEWRRIDYNIAAVVEKSDAMCGKGNWCGARLWEGR
jgi:diadenosine tetraphosphatase ApaH/serine/threonine PP2A family protein phosphatase